MKSLRVFLLFATALLMVSVTFAQDSTLVHTIQSGLPLLEQKWPPIAKVFGWLFIAAEIMALVPEKYIPANGWVHGTWLLIRAVFTRKKV